MGREKCGTEVLDQPAKGPGQRLPPRDENIVIAGEPIKRKHGLRSRPETPLGAVARNGGADFSAGREANADRVIAGIARSADFKAETRRHPPDSALCLQKILSFPEAFDRDRRASAIDFSQADSLLRPWARRRATTLRPPAVDIRALNP